MDAVERLGVIEDLRRLVAPGHRLLGHPVHRYLDPHVPQHDSPPLDTAARPPAGVEPPAGFTFLLGDLLGDVYPPGVTTVEERIASFENGPTRAMFNVVNVNAHHKGGHFGHYENPEAYVGDVRETFRKAR